MDGYVALNLVQRFLFEQEPCLYCVKRCLCKTCYDTERFDISASIFSVFLFISFFQIASTPLYFIRKWPFL